MKRILGVTDSIRAEARVQQAKIQSRESNLEAKLRKQRQGAYWHVMGLAPKRVKE